MHFHSYQWFLLQRKYRILSDHLWTDTVFPQNTWWPESLFFRELSLSVERCNRRPIFFDQILWKFGGPIHIFFPCICKFYLWNITLELYSEIFVFLAYVLNTVNSWKQMFRFPGIFPRIHHWVLSPSSTFCHRGHLI